ncbi:nad dependent epimerase, putative [Ichthyophthirius multifiliis]|uniref:Nad dependent epimerase, putative n=1 Tax=Ichthyophthirius multifiliis TaxID=5932 RepID=G0QKX4_ICHMU|nr:nad dependent epimerase, putative [Ichthyophthirius multifiliis]EGR34125.1 nad dependent epimerase, putative [Ichthyophthirius multifiliis]|eukprot:XP_004039429.1 nad dependent epimerase, putative [Ichthyophthirius multifiliis]
MGLKLLQILSENNYEIYYINRGKKYWNNQVKKIKNATHIFGNRNEKKEYTKLIKYVSEKAGITNSSNIKWSAVYDFCGYKYSEVQCTYEALKGLIDIYVFISTDSIYDACDKKIRQSNLQTQQILIKIYLNRNGNQFIKEQHAHKLKCEEFLYHYTQKDIFPFVILRLPDVIGPFDDTGRFWAYIKWIQKSQDYPIYIDDECKNTKISFVFSEDVALLCLKLIDMNKRDISYNSYNIAFKENITLKQFFIKIVFFYNIDYIYLFLYLAISFECQQFKFKRQRQCLQILSIS